ncbi:MULTISPECIES: hypothetical protein [unclassified Cupriavidus]|uniref:hypothetical protein n=1 Tax=unclassified Cupriavidus TaxID=2640874 RepID=UPI00313AFFDF
MGALGAVAKIIAAPYIRLASESVEAGRRVRTAYEQLQGLKAHETASPLIVDADNERAAFDALFALNKWTDQQLAVQRSAIVRAKWAMLATSWVMVCLMLGVVFFFPGVVGALIGVFGFGLASLICCARMVQCALFQTQIDLRALISFRAFLARDDFFHRLFK